MHAALREMTGMRVGMPAAVYAASVTEYLVSEVCERAGGRRKRIAHDDDGDGEGEEVVITEGDCYAALRDDAELNELTKHVLKK